MKLLVIDGNSIVNRAYFGIKMLTTKSGFPTNAIFGFLTTLQKIREEEQPDAAAIAFDMRAPTFRHKMYDGYKAKRKGMPEELAQQMPVLKELLQDLGYTLVECEGYEADDILGTFAKACRDAGHECVIATGDRDSLQLVGGTVSVRLAVTKFGQPQVTLYDEEKIREAYGVAPRQLIDIKALQGDSSDQIPGVAGIGEKTAGDLIRKYVSIDRIYEDLDGIEVTPSVRKKLEAGKDSAYLSYRLGEICTEVPIDTDLSRYAIRPVEQQKTAALMTKLELFKLMDKLGISAFQEPAGETQTAVLTLPVQPEQAGTVLKELAGRERIDFMLLPDETGGAGRIMITLPGRLAVVQKPDEAFLRELFCGNACLRTHDAKPVYKILDRMGIDPEKDLRDSLLSGYLLNPSSSDYTVKRLCALYSVPERKVDPAELPQDLREPEELLEQAAVLPELHDALDAEIRKNRQEELLDTIELPLARVLAKMENRGFAVDAEQIREYGEQLERETAQLQESIWEMAGENFNINSPKQLGTVLFEKLHLPHGKKTKSGYSTNADVLEKLRYDYPIVENVLQYRTVAKLKSTYCDGLLKEIGPDGRIHSTFNQAETRTGRISSTEPNLQNIPVRTERGREFRRFFTAAEGKVLVDADYSQIELRVLAHIAGDEAMAQAFRENKDIHRSTASQVFDLPEEMVTPLMRSRAKAVNFGIVYGIGAFSLSQDIGVTRKEADAYIKNYLAHYHGVRDYMERVVEEATEKGYAQTLFGRRRYLPELTSSNFNLRSFGQRVAKNMPIQGTAADIIKIAMIRVENRLQKEKLQAKLILQVHDELIVEAPLEEAEPVRAILQEEMESAVSLSVPMVADASIGKTWYDAKG